MKFSRKDGKEREHSKGKEDLRNQHNHSGKHAAEALAGLEGKGVQKSNIYQKAGPTGQSQSETEDLQRYYPANPTPYRLERMVVTDGS